MNNQAIRLSNDVASGCRLNNVFSLHHAVPRGPPQTPEKHFFAPLSNNGGLGVEYYFDDVVCRIFSIEVGSYLGTA